MVNKRLVIYFFYDKEGKADRYVDYFLEGLSEVTDKFIIVSNGLITPQSRELFSKYTEDIIIRKNKGFDVCAYKDALEYETWDKLEEYYEVCLVNSTIMGPVFPFSEMFNAMDMITDLDFWGVTKYTTNKVDFTGKNPFGYIPTHIQSHFTVYRNRFIKNHKLRNYWNNITEIKDYTDSVGKHESYFTKFFEDQGFKWKTYTDSSDEYRYNNHPILMSPKLLIEKSRCPIFKRRSFFHFHDDFLNQTTGEVTLELYNYLKNHTEYNVDLIWENIIRTVNQYDIWRCLNLNYILPTCNVESHKNSNVKVALIAHLYYMDDILYISKKYMSNLPEYVDIYLNTPHRDYLDKIKEVFSVLPNNISFNIVENRGRDVSSFLVAGKEVVNKYDIVCFYHDKKVTQVEPLSVGKSFAYRTAECALHNKEYIENIISTFENNPRLGMLTNIPPYNGNYRWTLGLEWSMNYKNTVNLAKELCINVDIDVNLPPIAPLGTVFWFRSKSMRKLFDKKWIYEDFPKEPNETDGTLLHAFERLYPYVVQDAGYYPAYVMPDTMASIDLTNFIIYIRNNNTSILNYLQGCNRLLILKKIAKKILPRSFINYLKRKMR